ncbi:hybrid sensor histidine kinase/response regulator [Marinicrinis sediminis]|uniref:histidine kinase n=1 Tax=Marinicrinis sediminis TaxID=1652465 RepID=A0ABW5R7S3_9BACL
MEVQEQWGIHHYMELFDQSEEINYLLDRHGHFLYVNKRAENISGFKADSIIGKSFTQLITEQALPQTVDYFQKAVQGLPQHFETQLRHRQGHEVDISVSVIPAIRDEQVAFIIGITKDISERVYSSKRLKISEARNQAILDAALDCIVIVDDEGKILEFNSAGEKIFGYRKDEVLGTYMKDMLLPPYLREPYVKAMDAYKQTGAHDILGKRMEVNFIRSSGEEFPVELAVTVVMVEEKPIFTAYIRDLTDKKLAETRIRETQAQYHSVVDTIKEVIFQTDEQGRWLFLNPAWEEITGYTIEESLGQICLQYVHPDDREMNLKLFEPMLTGLKTECRHEIRYVTKKGGFRWVEIYAALNVDEHGAIKGTSGTLMDITERKKMEASLILAKEEAETSSRAKSEFLSSMSHELRTPMNAILGFAQLLELSDLSASQQQDIAEIMKAGNHLLDLINDVLDLSKIEAGKVSLSMEPVEVKELVMDCIALIQSTAAKRNVELVLSPEKCRDIYVYADYTRLKQTLLNILSNAVKYNVDGGKVYLRCGTTEQGRFRFWIEDTGQGMAEDQLKQIFEPFYRIHPNSNVEGTGVGLSIAKRMMQFMEGDIGVSSQLHSGSTFWIELNYARSPLLEPRPDPYRLTLTYQEPNHALQPTLLPYTVLYIEDNKANMLLVQRIFEAYAHVRLICAPEALIGIELAEIEQPDLILMDIHLPGMSGLQAMRVLQSQPSTQHIPVIAVSANTMSKSIKQAEAYGFKDYITKPIDVPQLLEAITRILHTDQTCPAADSETSRL